MIRNSATHPGPSPLETAWNNTVYSYHPPDAYPIISDHIESPYIDIHVLSRDVQDVMRVLLTTGARVGEVLRITIGDMISRDTVYVEGLKGSASYTIYLPGLSNQVITWKGVSNDKRIFKPRYRQVWRECRRAGITMRAAGHRRRTVSHIGRRKRAQAVNSKFGERAAGDVLHHKQQNSILYYLNKGET